MQKQNNITKPIKENKKSLQEYYRNLSEDRKSKDKNYGSTRNKNMSDADRKISIIKGKICLII